MSSRRVERSRTFPAGVEAACDVVLRTPLSAIFSRRYGPIAPIVGVDGQVGEWGAEVGQTRTIRLSDGGTMRETLTTLDRPQRFGYTIGTVTGMMKLFVAAADGLWTFAPAGTGVRVTWTWVITPTGAGRLAMPVFARLWQGYARQAMDEIEKILVP